MRSLLAALVGAALLVAAVVLLLTAPSVGGDLGRVGCLSWDEPAPVLEGNRVVIGTGRLAAVAVLGGLGLVVLAGTAGFRLGRRPAPSA